MRDRQTLFDAISERNSNLLRLYLEGSGDPNVVDDDGDGLLVNLLWAGDRDLELLHLLLSKGADPALLRGSFGGNQSVLHEYSFAGWVSGMHALISRQVEIDVRNARGETPLMHASRPQNGLDAVQLLLESGADIHVIDHHGQSALHHASRFGNVLAVRALLSLGARPDPISHWRNAPLLVAARLAAPWSQQVTAPESDHFGVVKELIRAGADARGMYAEGYAVGIDSSTYPGPEDVREFVSIRTGSDLKIVRYFKGPRY